MSMTKEIDQVINALGGDEWATLDNISQSANLDRNTTRSILSMGENTVFALDSIQRWRLKKYIRNGALEQLNSKFSKQVDKPRPASINAPRNISDAASMVEKILDVMQRKKLYSAGQLAISVNSNIEDVINVLEAGIGKIVSVDGMNNWTKVKMISRESIDEVALYLANMNDSKSFLTRYEQRNLKRSRKNSANKLKNPSTRKNKKRRRAKKAADLMDNIYDGTHSRGAITSTKRKYYSGPQGQYWTDPNYQKKDYEGGI